jgi:hypothetical protein
MVDGVEKILEDGTGAGGVCSLERIIYGPGFI